MFPTVRCEMVGSNFDLLVSQETLISTLLVLPYLHLANFQTHLHMVLNRVPRQFGAVGSNPTPIWFFGYVDFQSRYDNL